MALPLPNSPHLPSARRRFCCCCVFKDGRKQMGPSGHMSMGEQHPLSHPPPTHLTREMPQFLSEKASGFLNLASQLPFRQSQDHQEAVGEKLNAASKTPHHTHTILGYSTPPTFHQQCLQLTQHRERVLGMASFLSPIRATPS